MRYLFIDKIKKIECNKSITAIKNVALSEDVFIDHFIGYPVMPGALQIETVAQAATALLEVSSNFKLKSILTIVEKAKFRKLVKPGDQLLVTANIISKDNESALIEGILKVNEKIVMDGRFVFSLREADKFYPVKTRFFIESVYDHWLEGAELIGFTDRKETSHE